MFHQDQGFWRRAYLIGTFEPKTDDHGEKSPGPKGWHWLVNCVVERLGRMRFAAIRAALLAFGSAPANRTASISSGFALTRSRGLSLGDRACFARSIKHRSIVLRRSGNGKVSMLGVKLTWFGNRRHAGR